jgi:hypothetical protein
LGFGEAAALGDLKGDFVTSFTGDAFFADAFLTGDEVFTGDFFGDALTGDAALAFGDDFAGDFAVLTGDATFFVLGAIWSVDWVEEMRSFKSFNDSSLGRDNTTRRTTGLTLPVKSGSNDPLEGIPILSSLINFNQD